VPLRAATLLGLVTAATGLVFFGAIVWLWFEDRGPQYGWGWVTSAVLLFSGAQLVMLGLIGEYLGRMFLTINQRPQAVVREVIRRN
jgi:undecaprenyl-phosphate 4-deoxy-4-formamido-L-arabinose transferase